MLRLEEPCSATPALARRPLRTDPGYSRTVPSSGQALADESRVSLWTLSLDKAERRKERRVCNVRGET
jgi:hypothetical protein